MGRCMGKSGLLFGVLLFFLLGSISFPVFAEKVSIGSENWGHEAGKECLSCHKKASSGLTVQWEKSAHAEAGVNCMDCHQADSADADSFEHEGFVIATIVSPLDCGRCHTTEYEQQKGSIHSEAVALGASRATPLAHNLGGPAIKAAACDQCHGSVVRVKGDGSLDPATWPNTGIGRVNPDGSKGSCSSCHGRHGFSKAQAREPESCARCHSGPDSPDMEVYQVSKHGMLYQANRDAMNLASDTWVAGKDYSAAPTCVTCHMGAAGKLPANHDVGMRNMWSLNTPVSQRQHLIVFSDGSKMELSDDEAPPRRGTEMEKIDGNRGEVKAIATPKRRRTAMSAVCLECHSKGFTKGAMQQFDNVVVLYNEKFGKPAQAIMRALYKDGHLTPQPFDEPIEFIYWELWHDEGARARHGASMGSPDHTWWDGVYLVSRNFYSRFLPQVEAEAGEAGRAIIEQYVTANEAHRWLVQPDEGSSLLGYDKGTGESNE